VREGPGGWKAAFLALVWLVLAQNTSETVARVSSPQCGYSSSTEWCFCSRRDYNVRRR